MASLFWVGGTATWDGTTSANWAASSGGGGGVGVPTAATDVFFDASSGVNTVTLSAASVARSINCTGFTGTLSHPAATTINIGDPTAGASNIALKIVAGMTYTLGSTTTSGWQFVSTSATQQTLDFGGKNQGFLTFNGAGGSWIFQSTLTMSTSAGSSITLTAGSLDTNGQGITCAGIISSNSNVRSLSLGASNISLSVNGNGSLQFGTSTNMTFNAGTSTITLNTSNSSTPLGNNFTYNNLIIQYGNGSGAITGTGTSINNLTVKGGNQARLIFGNDFTITGTLSIISVAGNSTNVPICCSSVMGTQRTLTVSNTPALSNCIFQDIVISGSGTPYATTRTGDGGNNGGMTLSAPRTLYWVNNGTTNYSNTSTWSLSSGGASGQDPPMPQDTIIFDANSITSAGKTISIAWQGIPTLDFTNVANNPALNFTNTNGFTILFGSLTLKAGMTTSGTGSVAFKGNGTQTINTAGVTMNSTITHTLEVSTSYVQLLADYVSTTTIGVSNGTFDANNFNVTCTAFSSTSSTLRTITMGSSTWTLTGTGTVWNTATFTNGTLNQGTSTIAITDTSATSKTLSRHVNAVLNNVTITGGGTGAVIFSNATTSTINNFTVNGPKTITFNVAATYIFSGTFSSTGTAGNTVTIAVNNVGTAAIFRMNGPAATASYTSVKDINANSAGSIWAVDNCTDNGNNHNIIFKQPTRLMVGGVG